LRSKFLCALIALKKFLCFKSAQKFKKGMNMSNETIHRPQLAELLARKAALAEEKCKKKHVISPEEITQLLEQKASEARCKQ